MLRSTMYRNHEVQEMSSGRCVITSPSGSEHYASNWQVSFLVIRHLTKHLPCGSLYEPNRDRKDRS
jgi:hypothetical protein